MTAPPFLARAVGVQERPYQREGIDWLWTKRRAMLTDAPGLGKTAQAALAAEPPVLVVAPTYLVGQWAEWLRAHIPNAHTAVAEGTRAHRAAALLPPWDFTVVNKEMLRTHYGDLRRKPYNTMILDEAHHVRSRKAAVSKRALDLARDIPRVYELTATPIYREVDDLWMLLRILKPKEYRSYWKWVDKYCLMGYDGFGPKIVGARKEAQAELQAELDEVRLGRNYKDAGRYLPPIIPDPEAEPDAGTIYVDFPPARRQWYNRLVKDFTLQVGDEAPLLLTNQMAVMHTLRDLTAQSKVAVVRDAVQETYPIHKGRTVVFTWYVGLTHEIADVLNVAGMPAVAITGEMSPEERREASRGDRVVVANLASLSEGVDLSWARHVIFAEENWPPGSHVQALMRVVRERQTDGDSEALNAEPVIVQYVVVRNTIDSVIHKKARTRQATVKEILRETLGLI